MPSFGHGGPGGPGGNGAPEKVKNFGKTLKKLLSYLKDYKLAMFFVVVFAIGSTVLTIVGPKILGNITTEIFNGLMRKISNTGGVDFDFINHTVIVLIGLYIVSALFSGIQGVVMTGISNDISYRLRNSLSEKINKLPMKYFDTKTHGEVLSIVTNDIDTLSQALNQSITTIITSIATIIGIFIMMISINIPMTIAAVLIIPICMFVLNIVVKKSQKYFAMQQDYLGHINGHVEEIYGGHDIVKAFNGEEKAIEKFDEINKTLYRSAWKSQFLSTTMHPIMQFIGNLGYVVISILGGYMVIKDRIEVGDILSFTQYVRNFTQQINQLSQVMNTVQSAVAASERIFDFLALKEEVQEIDNPLSTEGLHGNIEFDHVTFGYNKNKIIIHDFCAKVKDGQKIAIVGPTGAGKTTIVKLLMRFYELNGGRILIDGHDMTEFNRSDIRRMFGMVLQDTWLFEGSVKENIVYSKEGISDDEVINACKAVGIHHFIESLPMGYDTVLNDKVNLSTGQKQLITIARAMVEKAPLLILDEATSSVDTRTEELIQRAMDKLTVGRTSFVIAHRLSTIRNADLILVMKDGDIIESGNHEDLLSKGGFYSELYNSQFEKIS